MHKISYKISYIYLFCIRTRTNSSTFERTPSMPKLSKKASYIKEYEAVVASRVRKAYIRFCLDVEDSYEDEIDECMLRELAVLKESRYIFRGSYRQWETTWEPDISGRSSILTRRSFSLGIRHSRLQQWWFQPSRKANIAIWVRNGDILTTLYWVTQGTVSTSSRVSKGD